MVCLPDLQLFCGRCCSKTYILWLLSALTADLSVVRPLYINKPSAAYLPLYIGTLTHWQDSVHLEDIIQKKPSFLSPAGV